MLRDNGALLTIANRIDSPDSSARIPLAELDIDDAYRTHRGIVLPLVAASLTTVGCALFGGHYSAGEPLDPVFVFAPHPGFEPTRQ